MTAGRGKVRGRSFSVRVVLWVFRNSERREILGVPVIVPGCTHDDAVRLLLSVMPLDSRGRSDDRRCHTASQCRMARTASSVAWPGCRRQLHH